jgi:hypothetical protein
MVVRRHPANSGIQKTLHLVMWLAVLNAHYATYRKQEKAPDSKSNHPPSLDKQESEKCPKKSTGIVAFFLVLLRSITIAQGIPGSTPPRETAADFFLLF